MDPRIGPATIQISGTAAQHLERLKQALATEDGGAVMMRALGLLDLALKAKREGKRLTFYDPASGAVSEVAF